jgi:hypothetical protein
MGDLDMPKVRNIKVSADKVDEVLAWAQRNCEDPGEAIALLSIVMIIIALDNTVEELTLEEILETFTANWHEMQARGRFPSKRH